MKRPMAIPEIILEFRNEDLRENALRCLSNFLLERREEDPDNYYRAGFLLFNSCVTMTILMQEVVEFYRKMVDGTLNIRASKRVANVLTLFQSIAANGETRQKFVNCSTRFSPNSVSGFGDLIYLIKKLISNGKQLDAVNYAYAFNVVGEFPPVPLLKAYLKESKKVAQEVRKKGNGSLQAKTGPKNSLRGN